MAEFLQEKSVKSKLLILLLMLFVACGLTSRRFNPTSIKRGEAKIIAQEERPNGNYLVTSGFVRQFYDDCLRATRDKRYCEVRVYFLVVAENLDGTFWVKPAMVEEYKKKEKGKF